MKSSIRTLLLATALSVTMHATLAQDDVSEGEAIIIEDLSRAELRAEIKKIETEFYRVFNASIDEKRLEVHCTNYTPTMSHIKQWVCEPKFLGDARNENAGNWQTTNDVLQSPEEIRAGMTAEFEQLTTAMNTVLQEVPYFRELNSILRMMRSRLSEIEQYALDTHPEWLFCK